MTVSDEEPIRFTLEEPRNQRLRDGSFTSPDTSNCSFFGNSLPLSRVLFRLHSLHYICRALQTRHCAEYGDASRSQAEQTIAQFQALDTTAQRNPSIWTPTLLLAEGISHAPARRPRGRWGTLTKLSLQHHLFSAPFSRKLTDFRFAQKSRRLDKRCAKKQREEEHEVRKGCSDNLRGRLELTESCYPAEDVSRHKWVDCPPQYCYLLFDIDRQEAGQRAKQREPIKEGNTMQNTHA